MEWSGAIHLQRTCQHENEPSRIDKSALPRAQFRIFENMVYGSLVSHYGIRAYRHFATFAHMKGF